LNTANRIEVAKMFSLLGVSLRTVFPDPEENLALYLKHEWKMVTHNHEPCIHAIPQGDQFADTYWEQWFLTEEGEVVHRILFNEEPILPYHDTCVLSFDHDEVHPPVPLGHLWYIIEEISLMAWGVRSLLHCI